jgi:hypothetical protein
MVVSHKYRYLFIEIPLTGSWAIRHELCTYYGGTPILHKHATYPEFRRVAKKDELDYFVFATVRNPLDEVVSRYFKLKTDHKGVFSDTTRVASLEADYSDQKKYEFVRSNNADFATFFRKYHTRPFGGLIDIASNEYDFVIRYESLQDGFAQVLHQLGIPQVRAVPVANKTKGKRENWESYYTPEIRVQACRSFGPFMQKWGYEFPADWKEYQASLINGAEFRFVSFLRNIYSSHFRYSDRPYARFARMLRAHLIN